MKTFFSSYASPNFENNTNLIISSGCLITVALCVFRCERREDILRRRGKLFIAYKGTVLKQFFRVPRSCLKNVACYECVKKLHWERFSGIVQVTENSMKLGCCRIGLKPYV
jgi:hypothetical protein